MTENLLTLDPKTSKEDTPILNQLYDLIEKSKSTGIPIDEKVMDEYKDGNSAAIILWAIEYKKSRTPELENNLANNSDNSHFIMPYLKHFPDIKDGPVWEKVTTDAESAIRFAQLILKGRFIEGEQAIIKSEYNSTYVEFLQQIRDSKEK